MNKNFGKIGVLAGGPSSERDISLRSGKAVYDALAKEGLDVVLIDMKSDDPAIIKSAGIDVAFIALHGRFGEDGTIQRLLERAKIPYTGSGVDASSIAIDKIASKQLFIKAGIPTPGFVVFEKEHFTARDVQAVGLPAVVKPHLEGSSIGLSIVKDKSGLLAAVEKAFLYGSKVLVEEYIDGRELTVGILDDKPLPVIEIVPRNKVYDYEAKYNDPSTEYIVPAPIGKGVYAKAQDMGKAAHDTLGCKSFSRVDIMLENKTDRLYVLEVNTVPGMTGRSLLPKAAQAEGISFNALCIKLVEKAFSTGQGVKS